MDSGLLNPSWLSGGPSPRKRRVGPKGGMPAPGMVEFNMTVPPVVAIPNMIERQRRVLEAGFMQLHGPLLDRPEPLCIVGTGHSVAGQLRNIAFMRGELGAKVMAIKGACDWLLGHGIVPDYAVAADPRPERARIFRRRDKRIAYYLASVMDPACWEWMRGCDVTVWNPVIVTEQSTDPHWKNVSFIWGGATTGLRAIHLAWFLGFRNVNLFGYDSTIVEDKVKVTGEGIERGEKAEIMMLEGKSYRTTANLAAQAKQMKNTLRMCPGIKCFAYGEGLFQDYLAAGKRMGWPI